MTRQAIEGRFRIDQFGAVYESTESYSLPSSCICTPQVKQRKPNTKMQKQDHAYIRLILLRLGIAIFN